MYVTIGEPKKINKVTDGVATAAVWALLSGGYYYRNMLPSFVGVGIRSSCIPLFIGLIACESIGYGASIIGCETKTEVISKINEVLVNIELPSAPLQEGIATVAEFITGVLSNSLSSDKKHKHVASSHLLGALSLVSIKTASAYYNSNVPTHYGVLAIGGVKFMTGFLLRFLSDYQYTDSSQQECSQLFNITKHSALRACTGTVCHMAFLYAINSEYNAGIKSIFILPAASLLTFCLQSQANKILFGSFEFTSEVSMAK